MAEPTDREGGGMMEHRTTPHNLDAEKGVLGSILLAPEFALDECQEKICSKAFHSPAHATIYKALGDMRAEQLAIDFITLTNRLRNMGELEAVGGVAYVTELSMFVPTAARIGHYIQICLDCQRLRGVLDVCRTFEARIYEDPTNTAAIVNDFEAEALKANEPEADTQVEEASEMVMETIDRIAARTDLKGKLSGISTGLAEVDRMLDGLHAQEMVVIAARPSVGKTALGMNIAEYLAIDQGLPVGVFSLEMSTSQLMDRLVCGRAGVSRKSIQMNMLTERDFHAMHAVTAEMRKCKLLINDRAGATMNFMAAKARRWKRKFDIQLLLIDYLQLIRGDESKRNDNRQVEVARISAGIKCLAKELKIPIIVLAQLNRNVENRTGKQRGRSQVSDLRESGAIEQDADVIGLLTRPELYEDDEDEKEKLSGVAELNIAKQRNGETGIVQLHFNKQLMRFQDGK
jgi:replicative DNA helicase